MSGAVAAVAPAPLNIVAAVRRARNPGLGTRDSDSGDTGGGTSCSLVTSTVQCSADNTDWEHLERVDTENHFAYPP